jgi:hypothetical protein
MIIAKSNRAGVDERPQLLLKAFANLARLPHDRQALGDSSQQRRCGAP